VDTLDDSTRTLDLVFTMGIINGDDGQAGERDTVGSEVDNVIGGSGNDVFEDEWDVANRFEGRDGADTFYGRRATDTMVGGNGTDTLSYAPYDGRDRVYFEIVIDVFAGKAVSGEPTFTQMETTFSGMERYIGDDNADTFFGWINADYFEGHGGDDQIHGGLGTDTLYGDDGDDTIDGDAFDDHIYGGTGNDVMRGGDDDDVLTGDAGEDHFDGGEPSGGDETDVAADYQQPPDASCASTLQCP
jgi:Ca2+-binding RTX toxin-like protein